MEQKNNHRRIIHHLIVSLKGKEEIASPFEKDVLWQDIVKDVQDKKRIVWRHRLRLIIAATSVAALLGGVIWIGTRSLIIKQQDITNVASRILASNMLNENEICLVVSDNKIITLNKGATVTYSANGSVAVDDKNVSEIAQEEEYNQLIVPKGKYTRLVLADGSNMYVNAGTKVVYPRQFKKNLREIFVDGEIYIDVKRNETAPFLVKTNKFEVEVLGTAFNVNAYSEEEHSEVVLLRGLVKIKDCLKNEMKLDPNESASLHSGELKGKTVVDASEYILWTEGLLSCNAEPLAQLLRKLQHYYGIEIICDTAAESLLMNGSIDLNCSLDELLRRISITAPIEYNKTANGYIIKKSNE